MKDWEDLVLEIAETFGGQMPYPETSNDIAAVYHRAPQSVVRMADSVATLYTDGTAQNPWGMLRYRVKSITTETAKPNAGPEREKSIRRAEQRIRNELLHYDQWREAEDELFGERGTLKDHDTPALRDRMHTLWADRRPLGEAAELEHETRMKQWAEQRRARDKAETKPAQPAATVAETVATP